ncbi:putative Serine/threonine-protein kinase H1 like protein [Blattamonas nauphoetae]|uniref:Serine/threonine-protein kinase H1 like protein n=1 Tax=Blattamonas nauphoetae TaxID=2049346 RepID=A0ABQ9XIZ1_9EUKA|nr:putative Serine/threonine-protein kinase H1 like protein [Blattamonas nauphoetae]
MADLQTLQREGYGLIALKTIPRPKFSDGEIQAAQAMEHSPNKYIIRTRKIKQVDDFYLVVMEYADHGSLKSFMEQFGPFQEHDAGRFISNILEGLAALHEQNIMHRDMKPDNVLLHEDPDTKDLIAKITDFGLARSVPDQNLAVTHCGTPLYMAPEVCLDNKPYDIRADIWGVGIIFYELLTNSHPFPAKNLRDLLDMIKKPFSPIPYISQQCKDIDSLQDKLWTCHFSGNSKNDKDSFNSKFPSSHNQYHKLLRIRHKSHPYLKLLRLRSSPVIPFNHSHSTFVIDNLRRRQTIKHPVKPLQLQLTLHTNPVSPPLFLLIRPPNSYIPQITNCLTQHLSNNSQSIPLHQHFSLLKFTSIEIKNHPNHNLCRTCMLQKLHSSHLSLHHHQPLFLKSLCQTHMSSSLHRKNELKTLLYF